MCWPDKNAMALLSRMREQFGLQELVETGSAEGNGLIMYSRVFHTLWGCELDKKLAGVAMMRAARTGRDVTVCNMSSPEFLRSMRVIHDLTRAMVILDAHKPASWPILDELRALAGLGDCCIVIHDFKVPGLGYIKYGRQALDLDLVRDGLRDVNPGFHLYTNTVTSALIYTRQELKELLGPLHDKYFDQSMEYVWSVPMKTHRGILYATPRPLHQHGLVEVR